MRFAIALMDRFGVAESLVGDLIEARRQGRSRLWFWRQAVAASVQAVLVDVRSQKWAAISTAVIATALLFVWFEGTLALYLWASRLQSVDQWAKESRLFLLLWHVYCVPLHVAWCTGCALGGWTIARLHHDHQASLVLVAVLVQMPLEMWFGWPYVRSILYVQPPPVFCVGHLVDSIVSLVGLPLCTLAAGLCGSSLTAVRPQPD